MRILVTGGAGFIGSAMCRRLVGEGRSVVVLDKLTYAGNLDSLASIANDPNYAFIQADIADVEAVRDVFQRYQPDAVLNFAAESHVDRSISGAGPFIQTNVVGTYTMLEAALDHWRGLKRDAQTAFRFLHVSTDEVFGSLGPAGAFTEETPYDPRSPYSASKAASDHLVSAWGHTYGLPVLITNCSNNYGPYHFPEKLIPLVILNAKDRKALPVYGDGSNVRDWIFVDDHVAGVLAVLHRGRPGQTYAIGANSERTNLQVVQAVCDLMDEIDPGPSSRRELITFVQDRPGHDQRYAIDSRKIREELSWRPQETFETGLRKTVRWFLDNESWWRPLRERYDGKRLGLTQKTVDRVNA